MILSHVALGTSDDLVLGLAADYGAALAGDLLRHRVLLRFGWPGCSASDLGLCWRRVGASESAALRPLRRRARRAPRRGRAARAAGAAGVRVPRVRAEPQ